MAAENSKAAALMFHAIDTNGDGLLSAIELSTGLSDFGMADDQALPTHLSDALIPPITRTFADQRAAQGP